MDLVVCPVAVLPSEWHPAVWGGEGEYAEVNEAEEIVAAVKGHYNQITRELAEDTDAYAPVMGVHAGDGDLLWSPWINGSERAMRLRAHAWKEIGLGDDEEATASVSMIFAVNAFNHDESELTEEAEDDLDRTPPELIHAFVCDLSAWTKARSMQRNGLRQVDCDLDDSLPTGARWPPTSPAHADWGGSTSAAEGQTDYGSELGWMLGKGSMRTEGANYALS